MEGTRSNGYVSHKIYQLILGNADKLGQTIYFSSVNACPPMGSWRVPTGSRGIWRPNRLEVNQSRRRWPDNRAEHGGETYTLIDPLPRDATKTTRTDLNVRRRIGSSSFARCRHSWNHLNIHIYSSSAPCKHLSETYNDVDVKHACNVSTYFGVLKVKCKTVESTICSLDRQRWSVLLSTSRLQLQDMENCMKT